MPSLYSPPENTHLPHMVHEQNIYPPRMHGCRKFGDILREVVYMRKTKCRIFECHLVLEDDSKKISTMIVDEPYGSLKSRIQVACHVYLVKDFAIHVTILEA